MGVDNKGGGVGWLVFWLWVWVGGGLWFGLVWLVVGCGGCWVGGGWWWVVVVVGVGCFLFCFVFCFLVCFCCGLFVLGLVGGLVVGCGGCWVCVVGGGLWWLLG